MLGYYSSEDFKEDMEKKDYSRLFKCIKDGARISSVVTKEFAKKSPNCIVDCYYEDYTHIWSTYSIVKYFIININNDYYRFWIREGFINQEDDEFYTQIFEKVHIEKIAREIWVSDK